MVPVESVAAAGMSPNWVKPKRCMRAMEPALSAKMMPQALLHVAGQRLGEQPVKHERAYSPALPCRIDVIGQIGDTVISCAVIEHGERTEAND